MIRIFLHSTRTPYGLEKVSDRILTLAHAIIPNPFGKSKRKAKGCEITGLAFLLLFALFPSITLYAAPRPCAEAVFTTHPPVVDGVIQESEWARAVPLFIPGPSVTSRVPRSEVRLLWTKAGLYVAFRALDFTPVFGHSKPGDPIYEEDVFEMFIDRVGDHRQYVEIQMDPAGHSFFKNYVLTARPRLTKEMRFTPEFAECDLWRYDIPLPPGVKIASKLNRSTHLWALEAFLPASFVNRRYHGQPLGPATWRVNFVRHDWDKPKGAPDRHVQFLYWSPVLEGCPHISPTAMGYLKLRTAAAKRPGS